MSDIHPAGMFGIKLVGPQHKAFPFFGREGKPALMNFPNSPEGKRLAAATPIGHKSLVYLIHPVRRFWPATEYIRGVPSAPDVLEQRANKQLRVNRSSVVARLLTVSGSFSPRQPQD